MYTPSTFIRSINMVAKKKKPAKKAVRKVAKKKTAKKSKGKCRSCR
jgi:hypothetical protein